MKNKIDQRTTEINECKHWDNNVNALTEVWDRGFNFGRKGILDEIRRRIYQKEKQLETIAQDFSERDSLGKVWTKRNSKWAGILSEVAELNDLHRAILKMLGDKE